MIEVLCSGKDFGEAIRFSIAIDDLGAGLLLGVAQGAGIDDCLVPRPSCLLVSRAMAVYRP